jgi:hypothetical protein
MKKLAEAPHPLLFKDDFVLRTFRNLIKLAKKPVFDRRKLTRPREV